MSIKEIRNKYVKQIKLIQKHNKHYFEKNKPVISDKDYDELKKNIITLENEHKFLFHFMDNIWNTAFHSCTSIF